MPGPETKHINLYLDLMEKALTASIYEESAWQLIRPKEQDIGGLAHPLVFCRTLLRNIITKRICKDSIRLVNTAPFCQTMRESGEDWPLFGYSMTGLKRLRNIRMCIEDVLANQVPGDFIETGVWRGGSVIFMRAVLQAYDVTDRRIWAADSFEGMPAPKNAEDGADLSQSDFLNVSLDQVKENFSRFGLLDGQVEFLKGWFCDSLPQAPIGKLAILRLDGDMYSSTMDALTHLYHKVSKGGYVIVDDYHSWPSCRRAVTEFLADSSLSPEITPIDNQSVFWRCE